MRVTPKAVDENQAPQNASFRHTTGSIRSSSPSVKRSQSPGHTLQKRSASPGHSLQSSSTKRSASPKTKRPQSPGASLQKRPASPGLVLKSRNGSGKSNTSRGSIMSVLSNASNTSEVDELVNKVEEITIDVPSTTVDESAESTNAAVIATPAAEEEYEESDEEYGEDYHPEFVERKDSPIVVKSFRPFDDKEEATVEETTAEDETAERSPVKQIATQVPFESPKPTKSLQSSKPRVFPLSCACLILSLRCSDDSMPSASGKTLMSTSRTPRRSKFFLFADYT